MKQRYYDLDTLANYLMDAQRLAKQLNVSLSDLDNAIAECLEECQNMETEEVRILANRSI